MAVGRRPGEAYKPAVRALSVLLALGFMFIYSTTKSPQTDSARGNVISPAADRRPTGNLGVGPEGLTYSRRSERHLLSYEQYDDMEGYYNIDENSDYDDDGDNDTDCKAPRANHTGYNNSCEYVLDKCGGEAQLFDYLRLVLCDMKSVQVR